MNGKSEGLIDLCRFVYDDIELVVSLESKYSPSP